MSTFLCPIVEIGKIGCHPNADLLQITHIAKYPCIIKVGEFKEGDRAVYIPEEALVSNVPMFQFLWTKRIERKDVEGNTLSVEMRVEENPPERHRVIWAKKLRGIFSMGLLIPVPRKYRNLPLGFDMSKELKIEKYEKPEMMNTGGDNTHSPGWFQHYTEIEPLRKYDHILTLGEEVVLTEKVHGCFRYNTRIRMADGTTKLISKIKVGDVVLGMDKKDHAVPSKVLEVFNNGKADRWLKIKTSRHGIGRGHYYSSCVCTPNHQFYIPSLKRYVRADQLKVEDEVLSVRRDLGLTPLQQQILLGKILGDGYLQITSNNNSAAVIYSHIDKRYTEWTTKSLGEMGYEDIVPLPSGWSSEVYRGSSLYSYFIYQKFHDFTRNKKGIKVKKRVPEWVIQELGPIALAFWYMDDGSISVDGDRNPQAALATHCFDRESQGILIKALDKFNIKAKIQKTEGRLRLRIPTDSAELLFLLVAPYIPECMQYKLPERYRGHQGWIPTCTNQYKKTLLPQKIFSIEDVSQQVKSRRFDIKTETHNYFASDTLVHNCNGRFSYNDGQLWVGSHTNTKKDDGKNGWWRVANEMKMEERLKSHPGIIFYGEVYGQVQKGFDYGIRRGMFDFILFDAFSLADNKYLDEDQFLALANSVDLKVVPTLYRGPWLGLEAHEALADGPNNLNGKHIREGFVVKPTIERWNPEVGRVILKLHGQEWLLKKGKG